MSARRNQRRATSRGRNRNRKEKQRKTRFPKLVGTPEHVAWAQAIRKETLNDIEEGTPGLVQECERRGYSILMRDTLVATRQRENDENMTHLMNQTSARWWTDRWNRSTEIECVAQSISYALSRLLLNSVAKDATPLAQNLTETCIPLLRMAVGEVQMLTIQLPIGECIIHAWRETERACGIRLSGVVGGSFVPLLLAAVAEDDSVGAKRLWWWLHEHDGQPDPDDRDVSFDGRCIGITSLPEMQYFPAMTPMLTELADGLIWAWLMIHEEDAES